MQNVIENENRTLQNLLMKVRDQAARSEDFLAPTNHLFYRTCNWEDKPESEIILEGQGGEPTRQLRVNDVAFDQIAQRAEIDVRTARRLRANYPENWDGLINAIWEKEPQQRMIRAHMDSQSGNTGIARAFVSDKYKTYDNIHCMETIIPELMDSPAAWKIENADITDKRLYARFRSQTIVGEGANVGDLMALGIGISNSETGSGAIQLFQINWTLACKNGMQTENRHRKNHVTTSRGDSDVWSILSDEAKDADNVSLSLKLRDLTRDYASRDSFDRVLDQMKEAAGDVIEGTATEKAVQQLGAVLKLPKKQTSSIMDGLIQTVGQAGFSGMPVSRATFVNAVTAVANKAPADDVDQWQRLGGDVLNMSRANWASVSKASLLEAA